MDVGFNDRFYHYPKRSLLDRVLLTIALTPLHCNDRFRAYDEEVEFEVSLRGMP